MGTAIYFWFRRFVIRHCFVVCISPDGPHSPSGPETNLFCHLSDSSGIDTLSDSLLSGVASLRLASPDGLWSHIYPCTFGYQCKKVLITATALKQELFELHHAMNNFVLKLSSKTKMCASPLGKFRQWNFRETTLAIDYPTYLSQRWYRAKQV